MHRKRNPPLTTAHLIAALWLGLGPSASVGKDTNNQPDDSLRFVTSPAAPEVKLSLDRSALIHELVIENGAARQAVHVEVSKLSGPEIVDLECTIGGENCSKPFDLAANSSRIARLAARIDSAGTYRAVVSVVSGEVRNSIMLTVTRAETPFPLSSVAQLETLSATRGKLAIQVTVQEKNGRAATLYRPVLTLSRREKGKAALYGTSFTAAWRDAAAPSAPLGETWSIKPRQPMSLVANVDGLDDAGEYVGRVRFKSAETAAFLDVPLLITVKSGMGLAILLIALGVTTSAAVGLYARSVRPRLVQQREIIQLDADLARLRADLATEFGELSDAERAVVDSLNDRLTAVGRNIETETPAKVREVFTELDLKLSMVRRWVNARRRRQALVDPPAEIDTKLDGISAFLLNAGITGAEEKKSSLQSLEDALRDAWQKERDKRVNAVRVALGNSDLEADVRKGFDNRIDAVAREATPEKQSIALVALEGDVAARLADSLIAKLRAITTVPLGFEKGAWESLRAKILDQLMQLGGLPPGKRVAAYEDAVLDYLRETLKALESFAASRQSMIENHPQLKDPDKKKLKGEMERVAGNLSAARESLARSTAADAARVIEESRGSFLEMRKTLKGLGADGLMGGGGGASGKDDGAAMPGAQVDFGGSALAYYTGLALRGTRMSNVTANTISGWIGFADLLMFLLALLVSIMSGVYLLWAGNATWGSLEDCFLAGLWGLGLHQVANVTFEGVSAYQNKIAR